jgi:hypothetical protein
VISPVKADVDQYARNHGYAGVMVVVSSEEDGTHLIPLADFE